MRFIFLFLFLPTLLQAQSLAQKIQTIRQNHDLMGGVVVVTCGNSILHNIPFGTADYTRNLPVTDSTLFRIASVSKTVTAIAFMQLYEQGLCSLDEDLGQILGYPVRNPNFPNTAITPRMLLSHTSSIIDGSTYNNFLNATYSQSAPPNLSALLVPGGAYYTAGQFNNIQPGTYFNYSNINYGILGTVVEKVSGQRFDQYVRQHILAPLSITGSFNPADLPNIDNLAVIYRKINGVWTPQVDNYQGQPPGADNLGGYLPGTNGLRFAPQGGLRIGGAGLAKIFLTLQHGGAPLLQAATVQSMIGQQWQYDGSNGNNYYGLFRSWGLGIHRITNTPNQDVALPGSARMFGHAGEAYGLVSDAYFDTLRRVGVVFITNGSGTGYSTGNQSAFYTVEKQVFDAVESSLAGQLCLTTASGQPGDAAPRPRLFPNPAAGAVQVRLPESWPEAEARVFAADGRRLGEVHTIRSGDTLPLPPDAGLCFVRLRRAGEVLWERVVVR